MRVVVAVIVVTMLAASPAPAHAADSTRVSPNDNRAPAGTLRDRVLTLRLVARGARWRPEGPHRPEVPVFAFAEEGGLPRIPGPMIRVPQGTEVRATVRNALDRPLRIYGLNEHPRAGIDSMELQPGESREVRFNVGMPGTFLYWARTTARDNYASGIGEDSQLSGAIVVDSGEYVHAPDDRVWVVGLFQAVVTPVGTPVEKRSETLVFNGRSWPNTERVTQTVGDSVRWRVVNATRRTHPLHLHGFYFRVDARGTALRDSIYTPGQQRMGVTERLAPVTSMQIVWSPHTPGNWLFHCHVVDHFSARLKQPTESEHAHSMSKSGNHAVDGMSGLVLGIRVKPKPGEVARRPVPPARTLRLFITERAHVYGDASGFAFVLQDGAKEPASDSMRTPGSPLVLTRGEMVAITVINRATEPASIHWHGIEIESYFDGVSGWSGNNASIAPKIMPRDSFTVRMAPPRAGTFMYHTHFDERQQLGGGLYAPLIVLMPGQVRDTVTDRVLLFASGGPNNDSPMLTVNGQLAPAPIELESGTTYRLRFIGITPHSVQAVRVLADTVVQQWRPLAKDGWTLPSGQDVLQPARAVVGVGETADFEFTPASAGAMALDIVSTGRGLPPVKLRVALSVR